MNDWFVLQLPECYSLGTLLLEFFCGVLAGSGLTGLILGARRH